MRCGMCGRCMSCKGFHCECESCRKPDLRPYPGGPPWEEPNPFRPTMWDGKDIVIGPCGPAPNLPDPFGHRCLPSMH